MISNNKSHPPPESSSQMNSSHHNNYANKLQGDMKSLNLSPIVPKNFGVSHFQNEKASVNNDYHTALDTTGKKFQ